MKEFSEPQAEKFRAGSIEIPCHHFRNLWTEPSPPEKKGLKLARGTNTELTKTPVGGGDRDFKISLQVGNHEGKKRNYQYRIYGKGKGGDNIKLQIPRPYLQGGG